MATRREVPRISSGIGGGGGLPCWHGRCSSAGMTFAAQDDFFDDEPTLVHPREVSEVRSRPAKAVIPPPLPLTLRRVQRELAPDDLWLASLPAATRDALDRARRGELDCGRVARAS